MASQFQEQARFRKVLYAGFILALFTAAWGWRAYAIAPQARALAIREESRGDVELLGSVVRLSLTGSRGLVTCALWANALDKQKKQQWNELELLVRTMTRLQPHFITPWLFQSWNLSYNVAVLADRPRDKYFYISRGIELLARGERQNRHHPDLRWSIGFYTQHKIGKSDDTNYQRSLFQLSLIPPNERDPARFWKRISRKGDDGKPYDEVLPNWDEFEKFCRDHPQLIRRLRDGMHKENKKQREQLFHCQTHKDVVKFLDENFTIPALYPVEQPTAPAESRDWVAAPSAPPMLDEIERFPVLPPAPGDPARGGKEPFDRSALSSASNLTDADDVFSVAHAWYAYSQEPLPEPGELPAIPKPMTDRSRQRRPRHMTTLIFRNQPAQARRFSAERLQDEGWYDEEPWDASDLFIDKSVKVGGKVEWSKKAWETAFRAWESHGVENRLLFQGANEEENMRGLAKEFFKKQRMHPDSQPPALAVEGMSAQHRREYEAAKYMFEYSFYRRVSNFPHHYTRCAVERTPEAIAARKVITKADRLKSDYPQKALTLYMHKITADDALKDPTLKPLVGHDPLSAWRDLVMARNKEYRHDLLTQEQAAEFQLAFLDLFNSHQGPGFRLKEQMVRAAAVLPLVPKLDPKVARAPVIYGPFDNRVDADGVEYVPDHVMEMVMRRFNRVGRRGAAAPAQPGKGGPPTRPGTRPPGKL